MEITRKWRLQLAATAVLGLALMGLQLLPGAWSDRLQAQAAQALHEDGDWDTQAPLSYVVSLFPQAREVFGRQEAPLELQLPAQGELALGSTGCALACRGGPVTACASGQIFYAGEDRLYLLHRDGYQTRYFGLSPQVKAGQRVLQGETIGQISSGGTLKLTLLQDGRELDISAFLKKQA